MAGEDVPKVNTAHCSVLDRPQPASNSLSRRAAWLWAGAGAVHHCPGLRPEISSTHIGFHFSVRRKHFYFYLYLKQILRHKLELDLGERNVITRINMIV